MKLSQSFPNFIQGVSQQPPALRAPSQAEEQINGFSSAREGLSKRPHTRFVAKLGNSTYDTAKVHEFNKSENERGFVLLKGDGSIVVKDFAGTAATVNINTPAASTAYINVANPADNLELVTIGDYTFIVNRTVVPAMKADTYYDASSAANGYLASCVWVRSGQLETPYTITLSGTGTHPTATYNPGATAANANTVTIAGDLKTDINGAGSPAYTCSQLGSVLFIHRSGTAYDIKVEDGRGNEAMVLIQRATNNPANLPPNALDRFQVEITGAEETEWDNYWVEWSPTKKAWLEIPAPGRTYKIDPATMPHVLKYVSPGVYSFEQIAWADCLAGDTTTNPVPSFIGKVIEDLFVIRGRLGLLTKKSVVLSEAGNLFNFFRTTTTALLESDPIDVEVTMTDPAPLRWAVEGMNTVFLWSGKEQYYIDPNVEVLSPRTIKILPASKYECDTLCQPKLVGERFYYVRTRGDHSALFDYFPKADSEGRLTYASDEVTDAAPRYIAGRVIQMKPVPSGDAIFMLTETAATANELYVYQFAINKGERVQSALHKWKFNVEMIPRNIEASNSSLLIVHKRNGDGLVLEECDLSPQAADTGMEIKVLLDHRFDNTQVTTTYNAGTNVSTIELPYSTIPATPFVLYSGSGPNPVAGPAVRAVTTQLGSAPLRLTVNGDWTNCTFYVGQNYTFEYTLSKIIPRDRNTGQPITGGRLQINRVYLNYGRTSYFRVLVTPDKRDTYTYPLTGYQLGSSSTLIGATPFVGGTMKVPVGTNNMTGTIKVVSDAPFPVTLLNGDWEGTFGSSSVQLGGRI